LNIYDHSKKFGRAHLRILPAPTSSQSPAHLDPRSPSTPPDGPVNSSKRSPDERSDIRDSSLLDRMTLIEIERVTALKPQDSGHVANLD
jgi:hypothetical protein